jgi:uncharacterized protein
MRAENEVRWIERMKIWIDLSNSPHPLFFAPVARRLEQRGHAVVVTARGNAQTVELARRLMGDCAVVGGESPGGRAAKAAALAKRVAGLRRWGKEARPDVALSHNSYAQIVAARALGLPVLTAMDFEHQPANHLAFRLAGTILVPDAVPRESIRKQGAHPHKVRAYPGLKEEIYLGDFEPDPGVLNRLGLRRGDAPIAVLRTPPSRAVYHRFANPLFVEALKTLGAQPDLRMVVLPRHPEQRSAIQEMGLANCVVPADAIDSRSLMYGADLVVGAGGTMTREAALLGVPTWSVYAGAPAAVDLALEASGRMRRLSRPEQLGRVEARKSEPEPIERLKARSDLLIETFVDELESAAGSRTSASVTPARVS